MGLPHKTRYFVAGEVGLKPIEDREFVGTFSLGFDRTLKNPMVPILGISSEYFMGLSGQGRGEVGIRGGIESPVFRFGGGLQYEFRENKGRGYVTFRHPLQRGGVFWRGSQLRVLWLPGKEQSLRIGLTVPIGQPFAGRTRPRDSRAVVPHPVADEPPRFLPPTPEAQESLLRLAAAAARVQRFTVPYIDQDARKRKSAVADFHRSMTALASELDSLQGVASSAARPLTEEPLPLRAVREFHAHLIEVFRPVAPPPLTAVELAQVAREVLLEEFVLPYNRLLGQKKSKRVFEELAARTRVDFARRAVLLGNLQTADIAPAEAVFAQVVAILGDATETARADWGDSRMVWVPPQLALLPEEHDSQEEIDALVARAVGQPFTTGNRVWYVVSEQFQYELLRMIHATRLYHVLWIHDIRGFDDSDEPDAVAYRIVLDGYLNALAERLEQYDREGILPVYMIFLDQWYFEARKGELWLKLLEDPLRYSLDLPKGFEDWEAEIEKAQQRLRQAIAASGLLQAEIREYGDDWLYNRVRVQVNVTNPADNTFWTREALPWVGFRDDFIRDHRKISFYDVNPLEPWRGMALYTGMGVGEHYTGATWDDRAIRVQGPALLSLRRQARELLLQQGFSPQRIPFPLQDEQGDPWGRHAATGAMDEAGTSQNAGHGDPLGSTSRADATRHGALDAPVSEGRVLEVHNHVGYGPKSATVAKAMLYSLMPPGAVIKAPDSIWNLPLWGSLLFGHALRGGRVAVIAPTLDTAPARSSISLSRAQEVLGRLILAADLLAEPIDAAGGLLKVGLYNPTVGVGDIPGKAAQAVRTFQEKPWLAKLHGVEAAVLSRVQTLADSMNAADFRALYLEGQPLDHLRLHMKAQFFASKTGWDSMVAQREFGDFLLEYLRQRAMQVAQRGQDRDLTAMTAALEPSLQRLSFTCENALPASERQRALWYLTVGSQNQNYRSMAVDGEVLVIVSGLQASVGLADFVLLMGLTTWIDTPADLEQFLPAAGGLKRKMARWLEIGS